MLLSRGELGIREGLFCCRLKGARADIGTCHLAGGSQSGGPAQSFIEAKYET
jgi:hypothetical protein